MTKEQFGFSFDLFCIFSSLNVTLFNFITVFLLEVNSGVKRLGCRFFCFPVNARKDTLNKTEMITLHLLILQQKYIFRDEGNQKCSLKCVFSCLSTSSSSSFYSRVNEWSAGGLMSN